MPDLQPIALAAPDLMSAIEMNIAIQSPTMTWGPFGAGKSELHAQICAKHNMEMKDVRSMLLNPIDVNGLPHIIMPGAPAAIVMALQKLISDKPKATMAEVIEIVKGDKATLDFFGQTVWSRPGILPPYDDSGRLLMLFFDEINSASPDVQAALYQPVLDRRVGDHLLDNGVCICAAGNRTGDKGVVKPMPMPLSDRFQHYEFKVEFLPWKAWAVAHDIHPLVLAYLEVANRDHPADANNPEACGMLYRFNKNNDDRSVPTPRSWSRVSKALYELENRDLTGTPIELATIAGKVGRAAANEMDEFMRVAREGLTMDQILINPDTAKIAGNGAMRCSVIAALGRRTTMSNIREAITYVRRHDEEYQVMYIKVATREHPELDIDGDMTKLKREHAEAMA